MHFFCPWSSHLWENVLIYWLLTLTNCILLLKRRAHPRVYTAKHTTRTKNKITKISAWIKNCMLHDICTMTMAMTLLKSFFLENSITLKIKTERPKLIIFHRQFKAEDYSYIFFSVHIRGKSQCYASLHSNFHEYL